MSPADSTGAMTCSESGAIRLGSGLVMALDSAVHLGSFLDLGHFCQEDAAYSTWLILGDLVPTNGREYKEQKSKG